MMDKESYGSIIEKSFINKNISKKVQERIDIADRRDDMATRGRYFWGTMLS